MQYAERIVEKFGGVEWSIRPIVGRAATSDHRRRIDMERQVRDNGDVGVPLHLIEHVILQNDKRPRCHDPWKEVDGPRGDPTHVAMIVEGPKTEIFVDRVLCMVLSPTWS